MSETFYIKRGDTSPSLQFTLSPPTDLTGASVVFNMAGPGGASPTVIDRESAVVVTTNPGVVRYDWQSGDTATAGEFFAEFEVTYADNSVETFPNYYHIKVQILVDLG